MSSEAESSGPPLPAAEEWLLDGFNILHACFFAHVERRDWWAESHRIRLLERVGYFDGPGTLWVVFDGQTPAEDPPFAPPTTRVVFSPSADDWIVRRVRQASTPSAIAVVTGDRKVAARARHHGASTLLPTDFLRHCQSPSDTSDTLRCEVDRERESPERR